LRRALGDGKGGNRLARSRADVYSERPGLARYVNANPASTVVESVSPRERNILERIGHGRSNKEIARDLGIAPETVKSHVKNIFVKLAVDRRAQAVSRAQSLGLVRI
jgi:ATP/maltotriose-dependent transcriptional regulator MalT